MADLLDLIVAQNSTTDGDAFNATEASINDPQQALTSSSEERLARILNLVIRPVLIVFGTTGNGLSFYIMRQGSLKKMSTCFYLSILAIADTSKCFVFDLHSSICIAFSCCGIDLLFGSHQCQIAAIWKKLACQPYCLPRGWQGSVLCTL